MSNRGFLYSKGVIRVLECVLRYGLVVNEKIGINIVVDPRICRRRLTYYPFDYFLINKKSCEFDKFLPKSP